MLKVNREKPKVIKENFISKMGRDLIKDKMYLIMVLIIFVKTLILIGLLGTEKGTSINFLKGFNSAPSILIYTSLSMAIFSITFCLKEENIYGHL